MLPNVLYYVLGLVLLVLCVRDNVDAQDEAEQVSVLKAQIASLILLAHGNAADLGYLMLI